MGNRSSSLVVKDSPEFIYEYYQIIENTLVIYKHQKSERKIAHVDMIEIGKHVVKITIRDVHDVDIIEFKKTNKVWESQFLHKPD